MKSDCFSRTLLLVLSFAFVGGILFTFMAPRLITWYAEPAIHTGIDCSSTATWATATLIKWQLAGSVGGIVLGLILRFMISRRNRKSIKENF